MKSNGWSQNERLDYTGVTTEGPAPLEAGLYKARITEAKPQPTKENKPMIKLTVQVFEDGEGNAIGKRTVTDNMVLSQAALFRVLILAKALDIEPLEETGLEAAEAFCRSVVKGAKNGVFVRLDQETYETKGGEERITNRVKRYLSPEQVAEEASKKAAAGDGDDKPTQKRPRGNAVAQA